MGNFKLISAFFLVAATLSGCASIAPVPAENKVETNAILARQASCEQFYTAFDKVVSKEDVADIQATPVEYYPFLSLNRFLVSFKNELKTSEQKSYWLTEALKLNQQERTIEWRNLSNAAKNTIQQKHLKSLSFEQRLKSCGNELLLRLSNANIWNIIERAKVQEDYSANMRMLGVYPLTSMIVKNKQTKYQKATRDEFNKTLRQLSITGNLQRYVLDVNQPTLTSLANDVVSQENPLGIPFISSTTLNELFNRFAPTIEVDDNGAFDAMGEIKLDNKNTPYVDASNPVVYTLPSYTRFAGKTLLQLNYFFWFPEHPEESSYDLYSGKIDGLIWRVTLDENFSPLVFDSTHSCGCYHQFYSTKGVKFNLAAALKEKEPPFLAQNNIEAEEGKPWVLRISSADHLFKRVYQQDQFNKDAKSYLMKSYHQLRSLKGETQNKNLFEDNGIVKTSKRLERFVLWPMGITSAGAMRQWGHHATAMIGERYFDEPFLMDKYFTLKPKLKPELKPKITP